MLSPTEANNLILFHLGDGLRARHSVFVGYVMDHLAKLLGEDHVHWEVTGLCHDLDFEVTAEDRSRHGLLAAEWLRDELPDVALVAIQSHDHRTGILSETKLALALKLADAIAVGELDVGRCHDRGSERRLTPRSIGSSAISAALPSGTNHPTC